MAFFTRQGLQEAADQRMKAYGAKTLGSWQNGKILHNEASHPDHAKFDMLDHMRAASIHSKMADEAEKGRQYLESAHHRKQAAAHRSQWKTHSAAHAGSIYKSMTKSGELHQVSFMNHYRQMMHHGDKKSAKAISDHYDSKRASGAQLNKYHETLDAHAKKLLKPELSLVKEEPKRPDLKLAPPPAPTPAENTEKLLEIVRRMAAKKRPPAGEPPYIDQAFKDKLDGIIKKTDEGSEPALKWKDTASDLPGSATRAKTSLRGIMNLRLGEQLNKPEK